MIKFINAKLFFCFLFFFGITINVKAQNCTPDETITTPGFYPREELDVVIVNEDFKQIIQVLAIKDTSVAFGSQQVTAIIDSMVLLDVFGLPEGFTYSCNTPTCQFSHPNVGCVSLEGRATENQVGVYPLSFRIRTHGRVGLIQVPQVDTIEAYNLHVSTDGTISIVNISENPITVYPNPVVNGNLHIKTDEQILNISLMDATGRKIETPIDIDQNQKVYIGHLPAGLYWVEVQTASGFIRQKVIKM
jgi:hypothetical protein